MTSCLKRSDTKHGVAKRIGQLLLTIVRWYGDEDSCSLIAATSLRLQLSRFLWLFLSGLVDGSLRIDHSNLGFRHV